MLRRAFSRGVVSTVAAAGAIGACAMTTDVDRLTRGRPAGADAATDARLDDAGATDAVGDAPDVDGGRPFCQSGSHAFCADFDGPDPFAGFDEQHPEPVGELLPSTLRAVSSPRSLRARMPRREALGQKPKVYLSALLPGAWRRMVFSADVFLEAPVWQQGDINSALVWIECWSSTSSTAVYLFVSSDHTGVGVSPENVVGPAMPTDQWVKVVVDFDPIAANVTARIGDATFGRALTAVASASSPNCQVRLGINSFNDPIPALAVHFDNVTVDRP